MSLKRNVMANYASQIYVTLLNILILPLYLKYMGAEEYGFIGFFSMLQAWFTLLDLGLTPTVSRETARYNGGIMSALSYRKLLRALSCIFILIALVGGGTLYFLSANIATSWLNIETIDLSSSEFVLKIMAISVALRWLSGLYRGVITGNERLVLLSTLNVFIASARFLGVFVTMHFYGYTLKAFFTHQLIIAVVEVFLLWLFAYYLTPKTAQLPNKIGWSFQPVYKVLKFSIMIAATSSIWIVVTQSDKLILSSILPISEYGYFSLAVLVASGVMIICGPISNAIMPRMARLYSEGKRSSLFDIYNNSTQLVSVIAGTAAIIVSCLSEVLLLLWTNDEELANKVAPILTLYAVGNGLLAVSAFPFYLQYAFGNLKYHLYGNLIVLVFLVPSIIYFSKLFGMYGAGWVWVIVNFFYLVFWSGYVHHKLARGLHKEWIIENIVKIYFPTLIFVFSITQSTENLIGDKSLVFKFVYLLIVCVASLIVASFSSSFIRGFIFIKFSYWFQNVKK